MQHLNAKAYYLRDLLHAPHGGLAGVEECTQWKHNEGSEIASTEGQGRFDSLAFSNSFWISLDIFQVQLCAFAPVWLACNTDCCGNMFLSLFTRLNAYFSRKPYSTPKSKWKFSDFSLIAYYSFPSDYLHLHTYIYENVHSWIKMYCITIQSFFTKFMGKLN